MRRREFLRSSCISCMGAAALGVTFPQLTSCSPALPTFKTAFKGDVVSVPLSSFMPESNLLIVRDLQVEFDILLVRKSPDEYKAIYMKCSHRANPVTATSHGLYCPSHGSSFDLDGNATKEPATQPLEKFKTEIKDDKVFITLNL
jgi:cytochrome b6-f complex iron-sulfur subunit